MDKLCNKFKSSQSIQPTPNPDHGRTEQHVVGTDPRIASSGRKASRSQEIETRSFHEEAVKHDRTEQPVASCDTNNVPDGSQTRSSHESTILNVGDETIHDRTVVDRDDSGHEQTMLNEVSIDFRIPGLPHSVVKQADSSRVRELVQKIEITQIDMLFNSIYNKTKPTTR